MYIYPKNTELAMQDWDLKSLWHQNPDFFLFEENGFYDQLWNLLVVCLGTSHLAYLSLIFFHLQNDSCSTLCGFCMNFRGCRVHCKCESAKKVILTSQVYPAVISMCSWVGCSILFFNLPFPFLGHGVCHLNQHLNLKSFQWSRIYVVPNSK